MKSTSSARLLAVLVTAIFLLPNVLSFSQTRNAAQNKRSTRSLIPALAVTSSDRITDFASLRRNGDPTSDLVYLRWNNEGDTWRIQTAVTTFQKGGITIDLHAQLHFADPGYFEYYNSREFSATLDHIHYELLVDEQMLHFDATTQRWRLKEAIMAPPNDQNLANSYGWKCQASEIDYTQNNWIHADMTRQEFMKLVDRDVQRNDPSQPLWRLASPNTQSSAAAEAVSALLVGPPQLSYSQAFVKRRLFTNLFLPGNQLANTLRALLWMTVPAPELSIILLDWSSVLTGNSRSTRIANPSAFSEVTWPIFSSLAKLDVASVRRFIFGQVLVSSNAKTTSNNRDRAWLLLVMERNDHAVKILKNTLAKEEDSASVHSALLYGSSHCPDLHSRLVAEGFRPTKTSWRTAWSVQDMPQDNLTVVPALVLLSLGYLGVGALDWVGVMGDVSQIWVPNPSGYLDAGVAALLYLVRHALLYLGFSKFLVDWTSSNRD